MQDDPLKPLDFARNQLKGDPQELDTDTREKLFKLRHHALESSLDKNNKISSWASLPVIGFVTALIFISLVYLKPDPQPQTDHSLEDLEILTSHDSIEFYEMLEFLQEFRASELKNNED